MKRRWARRLATTISVVVLVVALFLALFMLVPSLLGYHRYVIGGNSMAPTLPAGTIVFNREVPVDELMVGDIITFVPPAQYGITSHVTHRIVELDPNAVAVGGERQTGYRTQGDNNRAVDPWFITFSGPTQAVVTHHIRYLGYVYAFLSLRWVQILLIGVPAIAVAIGLGYLLWQTAGDAVREERAKEAESESEAEETTEAVSTEGEISTEGESNASRTVWSRS